MHRKSKLTFAAASWICSLALYANGAHAQDEDLGAAANDPTASISAYQFQYFTTPNYHNSGTADAERLQFRAAIPFELGGYSNIFRITVPYVLDSPSGADGLSDVTLFNLVTFDRSWGRIGVGAVALLPTGESGVSAEKWGLGPAVGFIANESWGIWGLFNQNIFTFAGDDDFRDVNVSNIQPIVNIQIGNGWSVGTSDMSIIYDWEENDWVSLPVGLGINKLTKLGGVPWQFSATYERNFYDDGVAPKDTFNLTAKVLIPN